MDITFTDSELNLITEYGAALMHPSDIAIMMQLPPASHQLFIDMCKNWKQSPVYAAYNKGVLQTKFELKSKIIKLAKAGSPQAELLAIKFLNSIDHA